MMSNLQGNNSLFDNLMKQAGNLGGMGMGAQNNSTAGSNPTRDRLKKKLDARKNKNNKKK